MKSMQLPLAAIFLMTYFHRVGGRGHGPLGPSLDPLLEKAADHFASIPLRLVLGIDKESKRGSSTQDRRHQESETGISVVPKKNF